MVPSTTNYEGGDVESRGGDGSDVEDDEDGDEDAHPYAKEESVAMTAAISHRRRQQVSPSRGGRRVPPLPLPQKYGENRA
jgi:hypothetical protein